MKVDLHNHTTLCNHAEGEIFEYIEKAIDSGCEYFGFADHAPMDFDPKYRMSFEQMALYEQNVLNEKERYKDKINILLGYEVDFLEGHMDKRVLEAKVDYLIGSVHFVDGWGFDNPEFIGRYEHEDIDVIWQLYFDTIEQMAKSKLFDIVGHLDLIKVFKFLPKGDITKIAIKALHAIKEADMTLEVNMAGYRKPIGEPYPSLALLKEAYKLEIPITFASDAHKPEQVALYKNELIDFVKSVGYKKCAYYINRKRYFIDI